jgi:hypothetical protein
MASGTFYPAVSGDDGCINLGSFNNTNNFLYIGNGGFGSAHSFWRIPAVSIPNGATIDSVYLRLTAHSSISGVTCNLNCYFNDADNAVAPTNTPGFNALSLTSAVAWNGLPAWSVGVQYNTSELKTILQNIVDRAGWSSGNAVMVVIKDNASSGSAVRVADSYDKGSGYAELHVTWTPKIYAINVSTPMPVAVATGSDSLTHIQAAVTIPSMTAGLTRVPQISAFVTIPMMTASVTEIKIAAVDVSIPMPTAYLSSGIHTAIEITAPMMTAEGTFGAKGEATLPMMTVEMEGMTGRTIGSSIKLPMMTVEMVGETEHLANCDVSIPMMRASAELMTGKIITGAVTLPMMVAHAATYEEIDGDIDAAVPMQEVYMVGTAERAACPVLRYTEPVL